MFGGLRADGCAARSWSVVELVEDRCVDIPLDLGIERFGFGCLILIPRDIPSLCVVNRARSLWVLC